MSNSCVWGNSATLEAVAKELEINIKVISLSKFRTNNNVYKVASNYLSSSKESVHILYDYDGKHYGALVPEGELKKAPDSSPSEVNISLSSGDSFKPSDMNEESSEFDSSFDTKEFGRNSSSVLTKKKKKSNKIENTDLKFDETDLHFTSSHLVIASTVDHNSFSPPLVLLY